MAELLVDLGGGERLVEIVLDRKAQISQAGRKAELAIERHEEIKLLGILIHHKLDQDAIGNYLAMAMVAETNRSPLIRIPATRGTGRRIELRSPDPAGNPYLVLAACLAAGLDGLKEKKMPMPNVDKNIFEMTAAEKAAESIEELPLNLFDAVKELEADQYICDTLGKHASSKYIEAKYAEWDEYRRQITNWEIDQYLYKI